MKYIDFYTKAALENINVAGRKYEVIAKEAVALAKAICTELNIDPEQPMLNRIGLTGEAQFMESTERGNHGWRIRS